MELREYQREAIDAIYQYYQDYSGNALIVLPTASGKSLVMSFFIQEVLTAWQDQRILVLTHVKELIKQNYCELMEIWTTAPAGIYSAGLNRREAHAQILFAGIQSVHSRAKELEEFDLILIDESHLVPRKSDTMYRRFLDDMKKMNELVKIIGLTATHYRLDSGLLTEGDNRIFTDIAYEISVTRLIDEGFLCPLITKAPNTKLDISDVHTRGGEFINKELQQAVDKQETNEAAVREMLTYGRDRKSWIVFCSGVDHAHNIRDILRQHKIVAETVTGETNSMERDYILSQFKSGHVRAITNCDILTTGFNAPNTDMLAILRPTQSTGLYVQIAGRGMRIAPGKKNCLVLDFAGNIERHGPIDRVKPKASKNGNGEAVVKKCPKCRSWVFAGFKICPDCGYNFPAQKVDINPKASTKNIISEAIWVDVERVRYSRHFKTGKPDSLRVDYHCGLHESYSEWVCLEHYGYAKRQAKQWWKIHGGDRTVSTVDEALLLASGLKTPSRIKILEDGKFWKIISYKFYGQRPIIEVEEPIYNTEPVPEMEEAPF